MALTEKIKCNGIKPSKSEIYKLAAEFVDTENIETFKESIIESLKSYDYYYYYDYTYYYYYYYDYYYTYYYDYYYTYDYDYDYYYTYYYTKEQKVIFLLFLSAIYS